MGVNTPFVCVSRFKTGKNVNSMRDNTEKSIFHSILILCGNKSGVCIFRCADFDCLCTFFNLENYEGRKLFFFGIQIKKRANFIASQRIIRKRCPLVQNRFNNVTVTHPLRTNAYRFSGGMRSFWGLWRFYK